MRVFTHWLDFTQNLVQARNVVKSLRKPGEAAAMNIERARQIEVLDQLRKEKRNNGWRRSGSLHPDSFLAASEVG